MAKIDKLSFGFIIIAGKKYSRDVLIFTDGAVKQRKGGFLIFGSHISKRRKLRN